MDLSCSDITTSLWTVRHPGIMYTRLGLPGTDPFPLIVGSDPTG
jgi:hypothetical protein